MTRSLKSLIEYLAHDLLLAGLAVLIFASVQLVRHNQSARIWQALESGAIQGDAYCIESGVRFRLHIQPLGILGYCVFRDEMYVVECNGRRHKFACRTRFWQGFHRHMQRLEKGETGKLYCSFDDLQRREYFLDKYSGWKSPRWLTLLDVLFSLFLVSAAAMIFRLVARRKYKWRVSSFWMYCLLAIGALIQAYIFILLASSGQISLSSY